MKAYLALEDGTVFEGTGFGASGEVIGEMVFNTAIVGYQGIITDPGNCGQIVAMTYPLIGNYGIDTEDIENDKPWVKGLIVKEICKKPSNWRSLETLNEYLERKNVIGIEGIDTRLLTGILREKGSMKAIISTDESFDFNSRKEVVKNFKISKPALDVTVKESEHIEGKGLRIALIDYGVAKNIIKSLIERDCDIYRFPADAKPEEILEVEPDGILLSNGPGNPEEYTEQIDVIKQLLGKKPVFGIGLGHQMAALAKGASVQRLKCGHRGSNHPVKDIKKDRVYITAQNHGYVVTKESLEKSQAVITHININDGTVEGICYQDIPAFTVQFYPEDVSGPSGTAYLYDDFFEMMGQVERRL